MLHDVQDQLPQRVSRITAFFMLLYFILGNTKKEKKIFRILLARGLNYQCFIVYNIWVSFFCSKLCIESKLKKMWLKIWLLNFLSIPSTKPKSGTGHTPTMNIIYIEVIVTHLTLSYPLDSCIHEASSD